MPEPLARESDPALAPAHAARRLALVGLGDDVVALGPDATPAAVAALEPGSVVSAFGVVEVVDGFAALVEALIEATVERDVTVVLAVPNHAFVAPSGEARTSWDAGAFAELRSLLPEDHIVLHQVALRGSALVAAGGDADGAAAPAASATVEVGLDGGAPPEAFLAAFGPRAAAVAQAAAGGAVVVAQADLVAERAARTALESEVQLLRAQVAALGARAA